MMVHNVLGAILITSEIILKSETPAKNLSVAISRRLGEIGSRITVVCRCIKIQSNSLYGSPDSGSIRLLGQG